MTPPVTNIFPAQAKTNIKTWLLMDYETFYSDEYTLRKLTTPEYIADPRFNVHGATVAVYRTDKPLAVKWLTGEALNRFTMSANWPEVGMIGHNLTFDASILWYRYGAVPGFFIDTLAMSRYVFGYGLKSHSLGSVYEHITGKTGKQRSAALVDTKGKPTLNERELYNLGEYAKDDLYETATIFRHMLPLVPAIELGRMDTTVRMIVEPKLRLDRGVLEKFRDKILDEKSELYSRLGSLGVSKDIVSSNTQFATWLKQNGVAPETLVSDRTGKVSLSRSNQKFMALSKSEDLVVATAVEARLASKSIIKESRADRFIKIYDTHSGLMPVYLSYCGATQTNRYSGCVAGDTIIKVVDLNGDRCDKRITDVLITDLVWDGTEFVSHEGVKFSGYKEVISYDGITATPEHVVFTEAHGEVSIHSAMQNGYTIQSPVEPTKDQVVTAGRLQRDRVGV